MINIQFYVGCRVCEMVKSYLWSLCRFVYDDGIIDDKLFQDLSLCVR